jgi:phosphoenolpyruvate carboxylase
MIQSKRKLGKSEITLIKEYCSRLSDEELQTVATMLRDEFSYDICVALEIFQKDVQVNRWLSQSTGNEDLRVRADGIGELALIEINLRLSKKK